MTFVVRLLQSGKHSDFTIKCHGDIYRVHKAIVCPRSAYFDAATRFGKEAEENSIDLVDDEPQMVKLMVQYLYELEYTLPGHLTAPSRISQDPIISFKVTPTSNKAEEAWEEAFAIGIAGLDKEAMDEACTRIVDKRLNLLTHAKMYILADKYQILGLKKLSLQKFNQHPSFCFGNEDFEQAARLVYENTLDTDLELRQIIANLAHRDLKNRGITGDIQAFLNSVPELAVCILAKQFPESRCGKNSRLSFLRCHSS
ncbi:hypothetical protein K491DRAFT_596932 [Lophiostoma macrostomum CBS 122681]|uniref:BTB domain-containing protein n=1 Tax=Lophiostoma macrostomum CBS 122681 TaxID=1314788 RepID=A0A6A6T9G0_9PLEO|nr:hypothetical protein K491DRAFT_596932 [Lophiostoma macrostomum CBS 122681]